MSSVPRLLSEYSGGVHYPSSDGKPMAENTLQYEWIVKLKGNLDALLPGAFVAGDLFWYPVQGDNRACRAPDVLVAFNRPKGHRSSFRQWEEGGRPPEVVIEVLSPSNNFPERVEKLHFYDEHGVQEFIELDPDNHRLSVFERRGKRLVGDPVAESWVSPLLGVRFEVLIQAIEVYGPDGKRFLEFGELVDRVKQSERRADQAELRAEQLAVQLRALGIDPDAR